MEHRVEILDPSVLAFRPDQGPKLLSRGAQDRRRSRGALAEKPVGFMIAYAGLRDALHASAPAHDVAPLMREFADQAARVHGPSTSKSATSSTRSRPSRWLRPSSRCRPPPPARPSRRTAMPMFEVPYAYIAMTVAQGKRKVAPRTLMVLRDDRRAVGLRRGGAARACVGHRYKHSHAGFPADGWSHPPFDYRRFDGDCSPRSSTSTPVARIITSRLRRRSRRSRRDTAAGATPCSPARSSRFPDDLRLRAEGPRGHRGHPRERRGQDRRGHPRAGIRSRLGGRPALQAGPGFGARLRPRPRLPGHEEAGSIKLEKRDIRTLFRVDQIAEVLDLAGALDQEAPRGRPRSISDDPATYRGRFREFVEVFDPSCLRYRPTRDRHSWPMPPRSCGTTGTRSATPGRDDGRLCGAPQRGEGQGRSFGGLRDARSLCRHAPRARHRSHRVPRSQRPRGDPPRDGGVQDEPGPRSGAGDAGGTTP